MCQREECEHCCRIEHALGSSQKLRISSFIVTFQLRSPAAHQPGRCGRPVGSRSASCKRSSSESEKLLHACRAGTRPASISSTFSTTASRYRAFITQIKPFNSQHEGDFRDSCRIPFSNGQSSCEVSQQRDFQTMPVLSEANRAQVGCRNLIERAA